MEVSTCKTSGASDNLCVNRGVLEDILKQLLEYSPLNRHHHSLFLFLQAFCPSTLDFSVVDVEASPFHKDYKHLNNKCMMMVYFHQTIHSPMYLFFAFTIFMDT